MDSATPCSSLGIPGRQLAALLLMDRAANPQCALDLVKVLPLKSTDFTPAQASDQFRVEKVVPDILLLNGFHELF